MKVKTLAKNYVVSSDTKSVLNDLEIAYIIQTKNTKASYTTLFKVMIDFMVSEYNSNEMFLEAPEEFIEQYSRLGRRKRSSNTIDKENKENLFVRINEDYFKKFNDLLFSFLKSKNQENNQNYNYSYFVTDLINYASDNNKKFSVFSKKNKEYY